MNKPYHFDLGRNYMVSVTQSERTRKWSIAVMPNFAAGMRVIAELDMRPSEKIARVLVIEWFEDRERRDREYAAERKRAERDRLYTAQGKGVMVPFGSERAPIPVR